MTELEILEALLAVYQEVTGESGTMPEDIEMLTQSMIEVKETMLQIQQQNAKMYVTVGLIQAVLFVTCVITLVRGWIYGGRN
jgi:glycerol-3-phosphate responsive antiterminator